MGGNLLRPPPGLQACGWRLTPATRCFTFSAGLRLSDSELALNRRNAKAAAGPGWSGSALGPADVVFPGVPGKAAVQDSLRVSVACTCASLCLTWSPVPAARAGPSRAVRHPGRRVRVSRTVNSLSGTEVKAPTGGRGCGGLTGITNCGSGGTPISLGAVPRSQSPPAGFLWHPTRRRAAPDSGATRLNLRFEA